MQAMAKKQNIQGRKSEGRAHDFLFRSLSTLRNASIGIGLLPEDYQSNVCPR